MKCLGGESLSVIGFLQATGVSVYCILIGLLIINGERLFGTPSSALGPALFLVLFVLSALIVALLTLAYPIMLFWDEKRTKEALRLVGFTVVWLMAYLVLLLLALSLF